MSRKKHSNVPLRQWIGAKRAVPTVATLAFPSMGEFFGYVEELRLLGRKGKISHAEARMVCQLDGVFSSGYVIIVCLPLLLLEMLLVNFFSVHEAEAVVGPLVLFAGSSFLATALIEFFEYVRVSILEKLAKDRGFNMLGPAVYFLLYVASFLLLLSFFLLS